MMEINENSLKNYLEDKFKGKIGSFAINPLGKGCLGIGYLLEFEINGEKYRKILKSLYAENMGKEYGADRAQSLILAHSSYSLMKNHIRSTDVIGLEKDGGIVSIGDAEEFFIIMEEARGEDYFNDLKRIGQSDKLESADKDKAVILARYLADLHKQKFNKGSLYKRKLRDTIGGGESIMGVMDMYPEKLAWFSRKTQIQIVQKAVEFWMRDKYKAERLCNVHGDFHPGNIWFTGADDFVILDRARGEFGEAADDIAALTINFIFYSLVYKGKFSGALKELMDIFIKEYFRLADDKEMEKIIAPCWAFRAAVLCNPCFYPDTFFGSAEKADRVRRKIIKFALRILGAKKFSWKKINDYLK